MTKRDIFILIAVMVVLAVRLYLKHKKKENNSSSQDKKTSSGLDFPSLSKNDDYEPYSKK